MTDSIGVLPSDRADRVPLKVLHLVTGLDIGDGIVEMVLAMTSRLDRREWTPLVCGLRGSGAYQRFFEDRHIPVFVSNAGSPAGWTQYARLWTLIRRVRRVLRGEGVAILHAHNVFAGTIGWLASIGLPDRRRILTMHGDYFFESWTQKAGLSKIRTFLFQLFFRGWDQIVCVSEAVQRWVSAFGSRGVRISCIHNGIRSERFAAPVNGEAYRGLWSLPHGAEVVGTVGLLEKVKGADRFLHAAAQVLARRPQTYFVLIGAAASHEPETQADLNRLAEQLGLNGHVLFIDRLPNIRDALAALDLFVFASMRAGFGLALAEAMYLGKPVIAAAVGGIPEIIEDGVSGLLVPIEGTLPLSEAIERVLSDPSLAASLGVSGRRRIEEHFLAEHMAAGYEKLYRQMGKAGTESSRKVLEII